MAPPLSMASRDVPSPSADTVNLDGALDRSTHPPLVGSLIDCCTFVVVVSHTGHHKRDPLPPLQPREVVDEVIDNLHVLVVVVGRQGLALLVLSGRG